MSVAQKITLGAGAAAVAAGLTLGATGMAWAAEESPAPTSTSTESASPDASGATDAPTREGRGGPGHRGGVDSAALAEKLGVDEAAVTEALTAARDAAKPDAEGTPGEWPDRAAMESGLVTSLAASLGLDESAVRTAIDDLRAEQQADRTAEVTERLDAAVADGSLTRVEADGAAKAVELGLLGGGGGRH